MNQQISNPQFTTIKKYAYQFYNFIKDKKIGQHGITEKHEESGAIIGRSENKFFSAGLSKNILEILYRDETNNTYRLVIDEQSPSDASIRYYVSTLGSPLEEKAKIIGTGEPTLSKGDEDILVRFPINLQNYIGQLSEEIKDTLTEKDKPIF